MNKELGRLAHYMNKIGKVFGISACDACESMKRMIEAIENSREATPVSAANKFRVKSEETEIDWIS